MAVFAIAANVNGEPQTYPTEESIRNLVHYVYDKSIYTYMNWIVDVNHQADLIANQILYCQKCSGKVLQKRALHFILSYDTTGLEREMSRDQIIQSVFDVELCMSQFKLYEYQYMIGVHDNGKNIHLHIVINPINVWSRNLLNYGIPDYQRVLKELAGILYLKYRIALAPVSYINENGKLRFGNSGGLLYENIVYQWDKHLNCS